MLRKIRKNCSWGFHNFVVYNYTLYMHMYQFSVVHGKTEEHCSWNFHNHVITYYTWYNLVSVTFLWQNVDISVKVDGFGDFDSQLCRTLQLAMSWLLTTSTHVYHLLWNLAVTASQGKLTSATASR